MPLRGIESDAGAGAVLVLAVVAVVLTGAGLLALVVRAEAAALSARAAADLAALAAAEAVALPAGVVLAAGTDPARACDRAAEVARRNDASLVGCAVGANGVVTVTVVGPGGSTARARAGPTSTRG